jgi:hypothetical protein
MAVVLFFIKTQPVYLPDPKPSGGSRRKTAAKQSYRFGGCFSQQRKIVKYGIGQSILQHYQRGHQKLAEKLFSLLAREKGKGANDLQISLQGKIGIGHLDPVHVKPIALLEIAQIVLQ